MNHIVLIEPQIPQNTGNIARTCAAAGARLHIVKPMGFTITDSKLKRAGLDYWHLLDIVYYDNTEQFFQSARPSHCFYATTKARRTHTAVSYPKDEVFILFGREDRGLPQPLLAQNAQRCIRIPQRAETRSLNLSNSVAIVLYEVLRQQGFPGLLEDFGIF